MADFYVGPAYVFEDLETVAAVGEKNAAKKAAERGGITAGTVAVVPAAAVVYKTIESTTTIDASD